MPLRIFVEVAIMRILCIKTKNVISIDRNGYMG